MNMLANLDAGISGEKVKWDKNTIYTPSLNYTLKKDGFVSLIGNQ